MLIPRGKKDWAIYDKQVVAEFVLRLRAKFLLWDDLSQASEQFGTSLRAVESEIVNYERELVEISIYDEINNILRESVVIFGLDKFGTRTRENVQFNLATAVKSQQQLTRNFGLGADCYVGALGSPNIRSRIR